MWPILQDFASANFDFAASFLASFLGPIDDLETTDDASLGGESGKICNIITNK